MVITRNSDNILTHATVDSLISSHHAILCELQCAKPHPSFKKIQYRKLKAIDHKDFIKDIKCSPLYQDQPAKIDDSVAQYNHQLSTLLESHVQLKTENIVERPHCPWMNENISSAKQTRRKYERRWRKSLLTIHKELYLAQKHLVQSLIQHAKVEFYNSQVHECKGDQAKLFKLAESLLQSQGQCALPSHCNSLWMISVISFMIKSIKLCWN